MKRRKGFLLGFVIAMVIINAMSCNSSGQNKKKPNEEQLKLQQEISELQREMDLGHAIKDKDFTKEGKDAVYDLFKKIESFTVDKVICDSITKLTAKDQYVAVITIVGEVKGDLMFGKNGEYTYWLPAKIEEGNMNNPHLLRDSISLYNEKGKFLYSKGKITDEFVKEAQEAFDFDIKYMGWEDKNRFVIDGISVFNADYRLYGGGGGLMYVYKTYKPLNAKQIYAAIEKIRAPKAYKLIKFYYNCSNYANYDCTSQVITFVNSNEEYRVINGKPTKVN